MAKRSKHCGPTSCARAIVYSAIILLFAPLRATAQNLEPEKVQTEGKRPIKTGVAGNEARIESIVIRGNYKISASMLQKSIRISPGDIYDLAKIERAVTALRNMGYEVRAVTSDPPNGTKGGPIVIFYVSEKQDAATEPEPAQRVTRKYGPSTERYWRYFAPHPEAKGTCTWPSFPGSLTL